MSQALAEWLTEIVEEYLEHLELRAYSPATIKTMRCYLGQWVAWVGGQSELESLAEVTTAVLVRYQQHLLTRQNRTHSLPRQIKARSRNRHLSGLKIFFAYLRRHSYILSNPAADLEAAKEPQTLPSQVLTVPEMERFLQVIPLDRAAGKMERTLLEMLYGLGLRLAEWMGLRLCDCDLDERTVRVIGKGNKERLLPLGPRLAASLLDYLRNVRPQLARPEVLEVFVHPVLGGPTYPRYFLDRLRRYARDAGIKKKITFHLFRHTCATHLLRGGADIRTIQVLLGHVNLSTTSIYTRVNTAHLLETLKRCHPREGDPGALE